MKFWSAIIASVFAVGVLSGCGGGDTEAYCDDLKDAKSTFDSMSDGDLENFDEVFPAFEKLSGEAPDEVKDDWKTLNDAMQELKAALEDAGVTPDDLAGLTSGDIPEGADAQKLAELPDKLQKLNSSELSDAGDNVAEHADEECDIDLNS